jgi:DNA repair exonuclease SbcCD ATPase subunit
MNNLATTQADITSLKKQISELKEELRMLEGNHKKLIADIESSFDKMKEENQSYEAMHEKLLDDIHYLELETKTFDDEPEDESPTPKKNKDVDAKSVYRKISSLCHPDKTEDPKLHELYIEAKKAYEDNDGEHLEFLYSMLMTNEELTFEKKNDDQEKQLMQAIEKLKSKLEKEKKEFEGVVCSMGNMIHCKLNSEKLSKQMEARHAYSELLFRKIEQAAAKKEQLLAKKESQL